MYEHISEEGGKAEWHMKMMMLEHLTKEQQKDLMIRSIDLKIKKKELMVAMMRDKIRLMEEKIDLLRTAKGMLKEKC